MESSLLISTLLNNADFERADKFQLLRTISNAPSVTNDFAILVAMRLQSDEWGNYSEIAASYIRSKGLFPYLGDNLNANISFRDEMARDFFRSPTRNDVYMHRAQFSVLSKLLNGESIVLSAPTSFGKSFIIEELLMSGKFKNVVIIVPTVALIEELRQKIKKLHTNHNRVSFSHQNIGKENIFILTQERAFDMYAQISNAGVDLLIIDEFYKMDKELLDKDDSDRANLLNVVYRNFSGIAKQVYLLGPYINGVDGIKTSRHNPTWIESRDNTTYIEKIKLTAKSKERAETTCLTAISHGSDVMIYCSSPNTLRSLFNNCLKKHLAISNKNDDLIGWINENIGSEWYVTEALRYGVGVHHGKLPRFLAHEMIKRFGDGRIKILLCTSSLIEGVNTNAKTIIIHNSQNRFSGDILTFRNISGRAGRMFKHFWGTVYYYEEPAAVSEIIVNDSIGSDGVGASASTLSLLDDEQLTVKQAQSVAQHRDGTYIPWEILRQNKFLSIKSQEDVLDQLEGNKQDAIVLKAIKTPQLNSTQMQIVFKYASMLGLDTFKYAPSIGKDLTNSLIRLNIFIDKYLTYGFRELARQESRNKVVDDTSIEDAFYFLKNGMAYDFPKYIRALDRLQKYALKGSAGDLDAFANRLEYLGTDPVYIQLDELGLPIEFSVKYKLNTESTDLAVHSLTLIMPRLTGFERTIAYDFIERY